MEHLISENFKAPDFSYPADIDEDGDIDVAVVSRIGGKIAWFDNNGGSPPIFTERIVGYSNDARGVFVTDVDGDGEPDMLTTSALGGQEVIWWESDGAVPPNFSKHTIPVNGDDWYPVFATDLDDDGDTDVIVGNGPGGAYANRVIWLENNGSSPPSFTERVISTAVNWPYRIFATDLDDDGDIDVLSASMWDDKIAWYENDGGSPPEFFQRVISTNVDQASHVTAADVDGDGDIDVLSGSNRSDYKIAWFENDGNILPTFTEQIITNTAGHPLFTFPTDVDDDGDTDVLATDMYADKLVWYDNNGELLPTFTERIIASLVCPPPSTLCFAPRNIYGGYDIDGDGDSDVLALTTMNKPVEDPGGKLLWYENISIPMKFIDVPPGYWAEDAIYKIYEAGITTGCSKDPLMFCPEKTVNRDQMAAFLGRATHDSNFTPPAATGIFADVPKWYWAADWIEQFFKDGLTKGCKRDPYDAQSPVIYYCPKYPVTRTTMAIFLLRAKHGANYQPPPAKGIFEDVGVNSWAADWIEQLYKEGITTGCNKTPLMYCPANHVTRAQMAVFLTRMLGL